MLKRLINECRFTLRLIARGPLLIREGRRQKTEGQDREDRRGRFDPDSIPIRRGRWYGDNRDFPQNKPGFLPDDAFYYLPGTSIRGVIRSQAERIVRTVAPERCCDPFQKEFHAPDQGCGFWQSEQKVSNSEAYAKSCVICRLFGSTGQASRLHISDAELVPDTLKTGVRDHIGIDRFTGGVCKGANFQHLVLEEGTAFSCQIMVRNFELWQLGLLAYVLRDLEYWQDGFIRLGSGKTKGYGLVEGKVEDLHIFYYGERSINGRLLDLGNLVPELTRVYDLKPGNSPEGLLTPVIIRSNLRPFCTQWQVQDHGKFWQAAAAAWDAKRNDFALLKNLRASKQADDEEKPS